MVSEPGAARPTDIGFIVLGFATLCLYGAVGIITPLLPRWAERSFDASGSDLGLLAVGYTVGAIFCRPIVKWSAHRFGQSTAALAGSLLAGLGFAIHLFGDTLAVLSLGRLIFGAGETFAYLGIANLVNHHAGPGREGEATSHNSAGIFLGIGIGAVVGDEITRRQMWGVGYSVAAALCAVTFGLILFARRFVAEPPLTDIVAHRSDETLLERFGLRRVSLRPGGALCCIIIGYGAWSTFLTPYADQSGVTEVGWLFGAYSVGVLALRLLGSKLPMVFGLVRTVSFSAVALSASLGAIAVFGGRIGLWISMILIVAGMAQMFPALVGISLAGVPAAESAIAMSTVTMFFEIGTAMSGGAGWIADQSNYRVAFAIAGLVTLFTFAFLDRPWFSRTLASS